MLCTYQCNAGGGQGEAGHGVGIWHFSKICRQIPCPWANHSRQMQPNFPTPGRTLLPNFLRQNPRKAQWKYLQIKLCNLYLQTLLDHKRYMFLLQLQLHVLTIIRVTLCRIEKPFRRKSTFCKFKYTILSKLRVQRKSVLLALYSDCSEWAIHWSIVLARIDFVCLYFHLLWYHSTAVS